MDGHVEDQEGRRANGAARGTGLREGASEFSALEEGF